MTSLTMRLSVDKLNVPKRSRRRVKWMMTRMKIFLNQGDTEGLWRLILITRLQRTVRMVKRELQSSGHAEPEEGEDEFMKNTGRVRLTGTRDRVWESGATLSFRILGKASAL